MDGLSSAPASDLRAIASWEWVDVRCPAGKLVTRIKRRPGPYPPAEPGEPLAEYQCALCRDKLASGVFVGRERSSVIVLHYVSSMTARIVETRAILDPQKGATGPNRGGSLIPPGVYEDAVSNGGPGAHHTPTQEVIHGR